MFAKLVLTILAATFATACGTTKSDFAKLSHTKLHELEVEANAGNVAAAYSVARHYTFGAYDSALSDKWSRRAVELGDLRTCGGINELNGPLPKVCGSR
jgi:hypothetical protein